MPESHPGGSTPKFSTSVLLGVVLAATLLVYLGTLQFEFVYDDLGQIVSNPVVQNWKYVPLMFRGNVWMQQLAIGNYYRPLFLLWLLVNHTLFGLHPAWWHLTTVLAHVAATAMVFALALRLTGERRAAFIAALLFGLHPVHLEAVAWISGAPEPMLAVLLIAAFLAYLNYRERRQGRWLAASLGAYALGLLSKETAVVLPGLLFAYEWLFNGGGESRWRRLLAGVRAVLPFVGLTVAYLGLRTWALHGLAHKTVNLPVRIELLTIPSVLWFYLRLLVAPVGLSVFYDTPYVTHVGIRYFALPLAGVVAAVALLVWWWRRSRSALVGFASVWLLLPLLPLLNLSVLPMGDFVHDRYVYLPSVGFAMLAAMAISKLEKVPTLSRQKRARQWWATPVVVAVIAIAMAAGTVIQSLPWANDIVLYYHGMAVAPNNDLPRNKLAATLVLRGMYQEGINLYRVVLANDPDYWYANYRMGYAQYMIGQYGEAERYLGRAVALQPAGDEFYYLGMARMQLGQPDGAAAAFEQAIRLQPQAAGYRYALGMALRKQGKLGPALEWFKAELAGNPNNAEARREAEEVQSSLRDSGAAAPRTQR